MASEVFKVGNSIRVSLPYCKDLISTRNSNNNFKNKKQTALPKWNSTKYVLRSFRCKAARIWNSFLNNLRQAETYSKSRRLLHIGL